MTRILVSCMRTNKMGSVRVTHNMTLSCYHCRNSKQERLRFVSLLAFTVAIDSIKPVVFFHGKTIIGFLCTGVELQDSSLCCQKYKIIGP